MPRPKRSKLVLSVLTPEYTTVSPKRTLNGHSSTHSSVRNTTNSDDSEGLIMTIQRDTKSHYTASEEISMSGALASDEVKGSTRLQPLHSRQRVALSRVTRETDQVRAFAGMEKNRNKILAKARAPQIVTQELKPQDAQDEDLLPFSIPGAEDVAQIAAETGDVHWEKGTVARVKSALFSTRKSPATPGAESSILALTKFKRRPRQPSILQIGRQDDAASESELDDMLNGFHPDDESTPFNVMTLDATFQPVPIYPAYTPLSTVSSFQDRQILSSQKPKVTPPRILVPNSQSSPDPVSSSPPQPENEQVSHLNTSPGARLYELDPELPSNIPRDQHSNKMWSDIIAPPASSSPPQSPDNSIRTQKIGSKRKDAPWELEERGVSTSVPSQSRSQPLKSISTATLQNLLPRRHHRPAKRASGVININDSSDVEFETPKIAEDEDELSCAAPTGRRRAIMQNRKPTQSTKPLLTVQKKKPRMTAQKSYSKLDGKGSSVAKTYSRRLSDKENISAGNDSVRSDERSGSPVAWVPDKLSAQGETGKKDRAMTVKAMTELKTLAKKFKDVDKWEMEFEEVTASSSSPWDAR
ncbi:hypothetical protein MMC26_006334 [Xylographa opegraphella]|nr:hypothetical protein [Xylographa opegraphella]